MIYFICNFLYILLSFYIVKPLESLQSHNHIEEYNWGTYKANLYYAVRERKSTTLTFGVMWYGANLEENSKQGNITDRIRHECDMKDNLKYHWNYHNGKDFAEESIVDTINFLNLQFDFAKYNNKEWFTLIKGSKTNNSGSTGFILYSLLENYQVNEKSILNLIDEKIEKSYDSLSFTIRHKTKENINGFLRYKLKLSDIEEYSIKTLRKKYEDTWKVKQFLSEELKENELKIINNDKTLLMYDDENTFKFSKFLENKKLNGPNIIAIQVILKKDFIIEVDYTLDNPKDKTEILLKDKESIIKEQIELFNNRFNKEYIINSSNLGFLKSDKDKEDLQIMTKQALSNIYGGLFYSYGKIKLAQQKDNLEQKNHELLSVMPSRSFFQRGFLWDEGFHNIIISKLNPHISMDIINSWFSTISENGYIAREQIRGAEQEKESDERFLIQNTKIANPTTFIFTINKLLLYYSTNNDTIDLAFMKQYLEKLFVKLKLWYSWFEQTQTSYVNGKKYYSWNQRSATHNLPSGMDDLPRGLTPNEKENHMDLFIWMLELVKCLRNITEIVDKEQTEVYSKKISEMINDFYTIFKDKRLGIYNDDLGEQFQLIKSSYYKRPVFPITWRGDNKCGLNKDAPNPLKAEFTDCNPYSENMCCSPYGWCGKGPDFCNCEQCKISQKLEDRGYKKEKMFSPHIGYTTLFPLFFGLLDESSDEFKNLISFLESGDELLSPYGVRSLSKNDLLYHFGEDYWRGNLWMNMNFLTLKGLKLYYNKTEKLRNLYSTIRNRIIKTVFTEWKLTGMFYEQYSDINGRGLKARPFNGWTSLIVNILIEEYE